MNNHIDANDSGKLNLANDLFNVCSDAIVIIDSKGTILDVNQSALNLLDLTRTHVLGINYRLLSLISDQDNRGFEVNLSGGSTYPVTFRTKIPGKNDNYQPVEITINE